MNSLDKLDRDILNALQQDATIPLKELAVNVNSSIATCQRRIQFLIEKGVITKQVAIVSPKAVGRTISVFVIVHFHHHKYTNCDGGNEQSTVLLSRAV